MKLDAIASEQFTLQMQLAHALKDARLALFLAEPHTMPGLENIAPNCGSRRRTRDSAGEICLRISVAVAVVKSVVSYPRLERSGHGGHLSWRMGHQFESTVR